MPLVRTNFTGFATHNYQARVNGFTLGLDGWLYGSSGLFGGKVNLKDLKPNGALIVNLDEFDERNLKKAGFDSNPLEDDGSVTWTVLEADVRSVEKDAEERAKDEAAKRGFQQQPQQPQPQGA